MDVNVKGYNDWDRAEECSVCFNKTKTLKRCGTEHTRDTNSESRQWGRGLTKRTTEQQLHNIPNRRPIKQEIWFKDTPEDGARLAPKHVG
jgi:hypothetical protein